MSISFTTIAKIKDTLIIGRHCTYRDKVACLISEYSRLLNVGTLKDISSRPYKLSVHSNVYIAGESIYLKNKIRGVTIYRQISKYKSASSIKSTKRSISLTVNIL